MGVGATPLTQERSNPSTHVSHKEAGAHNRALLDGLRGVAILMILLGHFYRKELLEEWNLVSVVVGRLVWPYRYGVELFFVLSGYLITGILVDHKNSPGSFGKFYMRRFLRIFPLYYGALFAVLIILPLFVGFDEGARLIASKQLWLWTYLANWPTAGWPWDDSSLFLLGHFWSLCVEEQFYIFWPTLVYLLSGRNLALACGAILGTALISRLTTTLMGESAPVILQWNTFQKMDGLAVGSLLALGLRTPHWKALIPAGRGFKISMVAVSTLVLIYVGLPRKIHFPIVDVFSETLVCTFMGLVLLGTLRSNFGTLVDRALRSSFLVNFGKYSYGLYVIHGILRPVLARTFAFDRCPPFPGSPMVYMLAYYALTIPLCYALAYLSYHAFEKQFLSLKRHFEYDATSRPA